MSTDSNTRLGQRGYRCERLIAIGLAGALLLPAMSEHSAAAKPSPHRLPDNVVLQWNAAALQGARDSGVGPPIVARALAIVHTCIYDAWAAYDPVAVGTRYGSALRRPSRQRTRRNKAQAISFAAYRATIVSGTYNPACASPRTGLSTD
jgi:hypothetical protein